MIFKLHFVSGIGGKKTYRAGIPFHCNSNIHARFSSGCVRMFFFFFIYQAKGSAKKALRILNLIFLWPFSRKYKEDCIINLVFSKINIDSTYYRKCIPRFLKLMFSSFSFCKNCAQKNSDSLTFFRLFHRNMNKRPQYQV